MDLRIIVLILYLELLSLPALGIAWLDVYFGKDE